MSDVILKVENISKLYRLGTIGTGTFGGDVQRFWKTKILRQEDPFLKVGQTNDRTSKDKADFVWALQDINFEVKRGEVLGIIGKNGAGKSTLLKLLSRITSPTTGSIKSAGRMASLLEVGTGFHPELTGRENIFLNGAILGMTKKEIQSKFDEIVDFSGCELYIDTPVKRYSSGMTVRLGFAVAAFLDPEILVVDEVLAVGDAEFQKKAIGKMKEVSEGGQRAVLFVSHNMASIKNLCNKGILIGNGSLLCQGEISDIVAEYENQISINYSTYLNFESFSLTYAENLKYSMQILKVNLYNPNFTLRSNSEIVFEFEILTRKHIQEAYVTIDIKDIFDDLIYWTADYNSDRFFSEKIGIHKLRCVLPKRLLTKGFYQATFAINSLIHGVVHNEYEKIIKFEIHDDLDHYLSNYHVSYPGKTAIESSWISL